MGEESSLSTLCKGNCASSSTTTITTMALVSGMALSPCGICSTTQSGGAPAGLEGQEHWESSRLTQKLPHWPSSSLTKKGPGISFGSDHVKPLEPLIWNGKEMWVPVHESLGGHKGNKDLNDGGRS